MIQIDHLPSGEISLHLRSGDTSYIVESDRGVLLHRYWGARLPFASIDDNERALLDDARPLAYSVERQTVEQFLARESSTSGRHGDSVMSLRREFPESMRGDTRLGAFEVRLADGRRGVDLEVEEVERFPGMPELDGLPALRGDPETAEHARITLRDRGGALRVHLFYALPDDESGVIARHVEIENLADLPVDLLSCASFSLDLPADEWEAVHLAGAWGREREPVRSPLRRHRLTISSRRGASGHEHAPFLALCSPGADEQSGSVYAATLVYSGNHQFICEADSHSVVRFAAGVNCEGFSWRIAPGERFTAPQALLVHTQAGFSELSHRFHESARRFLIPKRFSAHRVPVVLNSWEALYFDVDAAAVIALAESAKAIGAEVLVIDDGWFEGREDDRAGLGDWRTHRGKFPDGLGAVREALLAQGVQLGIWMEPEMVSPNSALYREHPDWVLHEPGRERITARNQLVLDLSREEVQEWIVEQVSGVIAESGASYLKWDMNRPWSSESSAALPPEQQGEVTHRYMLGLYAVLEELGRRFPDLRIEGCAGGGARFDFGMLAYLPQYWTSDDTDAAERIRIQGGSSLFLPPETMGAHVSVVPNHQVGRVTPAESRTAVALFGAFGFELDPTKVSGNERTLYADASKRFTRVREWLPASRFYRLSDPGREEYAAFAAVSADRERALVLVATLRAIPSSPARHVRVTGLDSKRRYFEYAADGRATGRAWRGAALEQFGLPVPRDRGDWAFDLYELAAGE